MEPRRSCLRILGMLAAACACSLAIELAGAGRAAADPPVVSVSVGPPAAAPVLAPGFVSFSLEYHALHQYTGRDPSAINPVLIALLRALSPQGGAVLRVGGNSADQTWWPTPGVIPPGGITYSLTRGWMRVARTLAETLRDKLLLDINLAAGRLDLAASEGRALLAGIGRQNIAGFEIGNEPDLYPVFAWFRDRLGHVVHSRGNRYSFKTLTAEFARWRAALPRVPIAGPALASLTWMSSISRFLAVEPGLSAVTFHRYPLRGCIHDPADPSYPSIANLLDDRSAQGLAQAVAPYVLIAHARGAAFRLDELNSASCTGRHGVSDTFAAALWLLDTLFNMASVGVDSVNLHTLPGAAYEPFSFTLGPGGWQASVHPSYFGALMFSRAFPAGARLMQISAPSGPLKAWATQGQDGRLRVTLINKQADTPVTVQLQLPGAQSELSAQELTAPSIGASTGVTLGGQSFADPTSTGTLSGARSGAAIDPDPAAGNYTVTVAPDSAVLLTR